MPSTITMPTAVFCLMIGLALWIVFRDDVKPMMRKKAKSNPNPVAKPLSIKKHDFSMK